MVSQSPSLVAAALARRLIFRAQIVKNPASALPQTHETRLVTNVVAPAFPRNQRHVPFAVGETTVKGSRSLPRIVTFPCRPREALSREARARRPPRARQEFRLTFGLPE